MTNGFVATHRNLGLGSSHPLTTLDPHGSLALMILGVMIGGALGALCRYLTGLLLQGAFHTTFPLATLTVNVLGSFLLSLLFYAGTPHLSPTLRLALSTGFLGSFTTFSTFELETSLLIKEARWGKVLLYVGGNLGLGFAAILLGRVVAQRLV